MFEPLTIQSHSGPYNVSFGTEFLNDLTRVKEGTQHYLIDANIARLYVNQLADVLNSPNSIIIEATETNKSIEKVIPIIEKLVASGIRRGHSLVAVGGGIIQDITCFIGSTLLRGIEWRFVPTTLLAQADSCIGSKSSINLGPLKNILGTFNPPKQVWLCPAFLDSLHHKDIQSGIGEILKVHAIAGEKEFDKLKNDFDKLIGDREILLNYIRSSLLIKKKYIEIDEFDRGQRNIFNYGHSFGHAIESATHFAIPHGVAVSIGMDMANHISVMRSLLPERHLKRMHEVLFANYKDFLHVPIALDDMLHALMKDKKNTTTELMLILAVGENSDIQRIGVPPDHIFRQQCKIFLEAIT